ALPCGDRPATHDRGRFAYERVVLQRLDHEQGEVDASRDVALQDGVADVPAPVEKTFALVLFQPAAADHVPRLLLAKIRRVASTWSGRSTTRAKAALRRAAQVAKATVHWSAPRRAHAAPCTAQASPKPPRTARGVLAHPVDQIDAPPDCASA